MTAMGAEQEEMAEEEQEDMAIEAVEENAGEVLVGEVGHCLVLRKVLSSRSVENYQVQRESIFLTSCSITGRVYTMIIDGGSCATAVSQIVVNKLNIGAVAHPKPYSIKWLNHGEGLQVNQRAWL